MRAHCPSSSMSHGTGAGSLEVAPGVQLMDTPAFPAAYKPEALAGRDFLNVLRDERELHWTFLSPPAIFGPGERTGRFRLGTDQLLVGDDGESRISMEDFAIALVDELEKPRHPRQRFTVGYCKIRARERCLRGVVKRTGGS